MPKLHAEVQVIAHRGAMGYAPENTLAAFTKADVLHSDYIEFDIHRTKDGHIVIMHDMTIDRTTNGHGFVRDMNLADLKMLDAGKGEKIPTLEEVIQAWNKQSTLIIEFKDVEHYPDIELDVLKILQHYQIESKIIFKSFDATFLSKLEKVAPQIPRLYVCIASFGFITIDNWLRFHSLLDVKNVDYYQVHRMFLSKEQVEKIHSLGRKVVAWSVNDVEDIKSAIALGVDLIETDYPDRVINSR